MSPLFNKNTSAEVVAAALKDQIKGKNVLITGVRPNSLGAEAVRVLAPYANLIIVASRNKERAEEAISPILKATPSANIQVIVLDLLSVESVKATAKSVTEPIHVLINNAAVSVPNEVTYTTDGFENQFGGNHLGHFLFTSLLLPNLKAATDGGLRSRVINISSNAHPMSPIRFDDPNYKIRPEEYNKYGAYGQSKTANILFSYELAKRYKSAGIDSYSVHPGAVRSTSLASTITIDELRSMGLINPDGSYVDPDQWKTVHAGAATHIVAAFDPSITEQSGSYLCDAGLAPDSAVADHAKDPDAAAKLWTLSEELLKIKF